MNGWKSTLKLLSGSRVKDIIIHMMKFIGACKFLCSKKNYKLPLKIGLLNM